MMRGIKAFHRVSEHAEIGGVLGGVAYQMEVPAWIPKIIFILVSIVLLNVVSAFIFLYVLLWVLVPQYESDPDDYDKVTSWSE